MQSRFASSVDLGPCQAGGILKNELRLKAVALLGVVMSEDENEEGESDLVVAVALFNKSARGALLVREVGVALLLRFTREGWIYVFLLSSLRSRYHVFKMGRVPSISNIRSVFVMTITYRAVYVFYLATNIIVEW